MQTRIWGLLEWLLHHWKAVKNNKIKKACVTVSLCGLQTWNIYTLVHHRKNIFALESTVSVLEGSLRTVVYHGHSAALLEVKVKVWEWQRSQGWCYRCVLWSQRELRFSHCGVQLPEALSVGLWGQNYFVITAQHRCPLSVDTKVDTRWLYESSGGSPRANQGSGTTLVFSAVHSK